ncbi:MAG: ExeA family protein [Pirellulales bacterium]
MYETHFKLQGRPFLPTPQVDRYFPAAAIENSRQTLSRSIQRGEGPGLLIGPAGTGKTLLCQVLALEFAGSFAVAQLTSGRMATRAAFLQALLYELGLPYRAMDEGELRLSLVDFLEPKADGHAGLLLLVDEAHTLPLRLLEEIRLLTNLVRDGQSRVRVVLAGSPLLEERFASPKLCSFAQRLAARCYLEPFNAAETSDYVRAQLASVGGNAAQLFDADALRSVYRASDGIPRLINQVCDHALMLASLSGTRTVTSDTVEEAWADLQQLPTPWSAGSREAARSGVVEFGQLSDGLDEPPSAIPFPAQLSAGLHVAKVDDAHTGTKPPIVHQSSSHHKDAAAGETEVELDFPEFGDPLNEEFAEEEVVLDRYASDGELFADVPRVSSWEGRQISELLSPLAAPARLAMSSDSSAEFSYSVIRDEPAAGNYSYASTPEFPTVLSNVVNPVVVGEAAPRTAQPVVAADDAAAFWAETRAAGDEQDIVVVENEVARSVVHPPRKREYRQLFAKLRRG